jgi:hypothetical protein
VNRRRLLEKALASPKNLRFDKLVERYNLQLGDKE